MATAARAERLAPCKYRLTVDAVDAREVRALEGGLSQRASTAMMVADGREAAPASSPEAPVAGEADAPRRRDTNGNRRIPCHEALARRRLGAGARLGASCATGTAMAWCASEGADRHA